MSERNDGGPAFPSEFHEWNDYDSKYYPTVWQRGMTLRDWFAGQALAGIVPTVRASEPQDIRTVAKVCYLYADEMLAARKEA